MQCYCAACDAMPWQVAPPGAANANDVDTIRYASPISGYPTTVPCSRHVTTSRPREKRRRYSQGSWSFTGPQLKAGWMAAVSSVHQGAVRRRRVRSTAARLTSPLNVVQRPGLAGSDLDCCRNFGGDNNAMGPRGATWISAGSCRSLTRADGRGGGGAGNQTEWTDVYGRFMTVDVADHLTTVIRSSRHSVRLPASSVCACLVLVRRFWLRLNATCVRTAVCDLR